MLRCTIELLPDIKDGTKGTIIKVIDIKEDGTGSYLEGNYKMQVYNTPGAHDDSDWIPKVVRGMQYHRFKHTKLLQRALETYNVLMDRGLIISSL